MATVDYFASWRQDRVGTATVVIGGTSVSMATGLYSHLLDATINGEAIATFADALNTAIGAAGLTGVAVAFDYTTLRYTITSTPARTLVFNTAGVPGQLMASILGFTNSSFGAATSFTSSIRPYYVIRPALAARVDPSGIYEEESVARRVSDTGFGYAVGPTSPRRSFACEHHFEPVAVVFADRASASVPWTWQHFFEHAGRYQETVLSYASPPVGMMDSAVCQLATPNFTRELRERQIRGLDAYWKVKLQFAFLSQY